MSLLREQAIKSRGVKFVETAKAKKEVAEERAQMVYDAKETAKKLCELMERCTKYQLLTTFLGDRNKRPKFSVHVFRRVGYEDVRRFVYLR